MNLEEGLSVRGWQVIVSCFGHCPCESVEVWDKVRLVMGNE